MVLVVVVVVVVMVVEVVVLVEVYATESFITKSLHRVI